jgi:hypothetical protein
VIQHLIITIWYGLDTSHEDGPNQYQSITIQHYTQQHRAVQKSSITIPHISLSHIPTLWLLNHYIHPHISTQYRTSQNWRYFCYRAHYQHIPKSLIATVITRWSNTTRSSTASLTSFLDHHQYWTFDSTLEVPSSTDTVDEHHWHWTFAPRSLGGPQYFWYRRRWRRSTAPFRTFPSNMPYSDESTPPAELSGSCLW